LGWIAFVWMGWRILRGEWRNHLLIWGWTGLYFLWQGTAFVSSMRYLLPIYPSLAIIAAWGIFTLRNAGNAPRRRRLNWAKIISTGTAVTVLVGTFAWAFAFTRIYTRPVSRLAASHWIYENVPGAINLRMTTLTGEYQQPLGSLGALTMMSEHPLTLTFDAPASVTLREITITRLSDAQWSGDSRTLSFSIYAAHSPDSSVLASGMLTSAFAAEQSITIPLSIPLILDPAVEYVIQFAVMEPGAMMRFAGYLELGLQDEDRIYRHRVAEFVQLITPTQSFQVPPFRVMQAGTLNGIWLENIVDWESQPDLKTLRVSLALPGQETQPLAVAQIQDTFQRQTDFRGESFWLEFNPPVEIVADGVYTLTFELTTGNGAIALTNSKVAIESSWDDAVPLSIGQGGPYDVNWGPYRTDLNFEMYWDDSVDKRDRIISILNNTDYIFMSSNRQWGTIPRVMERYPLSAFYYRHLLGCPPEKDVVWCYSVAEPGMFQGDLGFELVHAGTSYPNLGGLEFNTQFAEEAFSVYDHPKVMIFKKTGDYQPLAVQALLESVDLSNIVRLTPRQAGGYKGNLMLPADRLAQQQAGGTWSELFDTGALYNRYPGLALLLWYISITLLGWLVYPFVRLAMGGLADKGYPFARLIGLLLLALLTWLAGSAGIAFSRPTILVVLGILSIGSLILGWLQRDGLREEWRTRSRYFLAVELIGLVFFGLFLLVRLGNPDLWHAFKGGEKPMDFSYFNAVLKSTTFPPFDPWFSGGYLNYYYYGFVIIGVPVKFLGIVPAIAYNLILPTWFSLMALGAFSIGWNLLNACQPSPSLPNHRSVADPNNFPSVPAEGDLQPIPDSDGLHSPGKADNLQPMVGADSDFQSSMPTPGLEFSQDAIDGKLLPPVELERINLAAGTSSELTDIAPGVTPDTGAVTVTTDGATAAAQNAVAAVTNPPLLSVHQAKPTNWHLYLAGLTAALAILILGNLGTIRQIWHSIQRLAAPGGVIEEATFVERWIWTFDGLAKFMDGSRLPVGVGDWYWVPSRAIPGEAITEFPLFTFLYADPHAHLIALPVTVLAIGWALSVLLGRWRWTNRQRGLAFAASMLLGGVALGALRPTNTWDMYTFLPLGAIVLGYTAWQYADWPFRWLSSWPVRLQRFVIALLSMALLGGLALLLYAPFTHWFGTAYNSFSLWKYDHTPFWSYVTHWGVFLFVLLGWMFWETRDWLAKTRLSALKRLEPHLIWLVPAILITIAVIVLLMSGITTLGLPEEVLAQLNAPGVAIAWLVIPMIIWAGILILRPRQPDAKRMVLFMVGTALTLTMVVELFVLVGDIGRMNTVFKLYLQAWTLLSLSAAAALCWLWPEINLHWTPRWRSTWQVVFALLVGSALLFPLIAGADKIRDRMNNGAPHSLDGMAYMPYGSFYENGVNIEFAEDYRAIRWMQENVSGSPVIVEGRVGEYHWGNRFTIYTGLPNVLGWNWHQSQQRAGATQPWVAQRLNDIMLFYTTVERGETEDFLARYEVSYIIVGQLERAAHPGPGLDKFVQWDGDLWDQVYSDGATIIYKVRR
jgi:YYY domain-containing protein